MSDQQIKLDWERRRRLGFDEAVFCTGKSTAQLTTILDQVAAAEERMLLTRLDEDMFACLPDIHRNALDYDAVSRTAFFGRPTQEGVRTTAVVTAGTSDVRSPRRAPSHVRRRRYCSPHLPQPERRLPIGRGR